MITETINIAGMTCDHCIKSIDEVIKKLPVDKYEVKLGSLYVEYNSEKIERKEILDAITESGFDVINNS
ncbi:MAG: heavy-metal-associated domain-containing protein [Ignavibacteria bacterium]|nr:heavy-metal-associated domain-containing protein [Ignavibacteria bacterium]HMQ78750.1 cation transporter [Ignavibacteria bacterium]HMQ97512.1 cation transporter [Ignavibacteria bacterium]